MPVLPLVGSTIVVFGSETAFLFGGLDHGGTDAVLDAAQRIEELGLERDRRFQARREAVEFDEWRAPHGAENVRVQSK